MADSDIELQKTVAGHGVAIINLQTDVGEMKSDLKEALKRYPPGVSWVITTLCSLVTGLSVFLLTHASGGG